MWYFISFMYDWLISLVLLSNIYIPRLQGTLTSENHCLNDQKSLNWVKWSSLSRFWIPIKSTPAKTKIVIETKLIHNQISSYRQNADYCFGYWSRVRLIFVSVRLSIYPFFSCLRQQFSCTSSFKGNIICQTIRMYDLNYSENKISYTISY